MFSFPKEGRIYKTILMEKNRNKMMISKVTHYDFRPYYIPRINV